MVGVTVVLRLSHLFATTPISLPNDKTTVVVQYHGSGR